MALFRWIAAMRRRLSPEERIRKIAGSILKKCPVCDLTLDGHSYSELATIVANDAQACSAADEAARNGKWSALMGYQRWDPDADIIEYDAIRCNRRATLGLIAVLYTAEMWTDDSLIDKRSLSSNESADLLAVIGERWHSF